ncbi:hypothetical protein HMI55_002886 [Coelomomyces lativittatus]|nr:hypothetical protein HMI55_002886 [Coelomomyces lativittatus]
MLCVGSINSFASGIGGGGYMLIRIPSNGSVPLHSTFDVIDFRETAPRKVNFKMYPTPSVSTKGALSVGVPGEIHGMKLAHDLYGKLSWCELFYPIIRMNQDGFRVSRMLSLTLQKYEAWIRINKPWSDIFVRNGALVTEGSIIQRINYASTLQQIADHGIDAFYKGTIAHSLSNFIHEQGGVLDLLDLQNYRPLRKKAIHMNYRGMDVYSTPAPASGHLLLFMLNIMETFEKKSVPDGLYYHHMVESLRYAFAKRSSLGDPDFSNLTSLLSELLSKETAYQIKLNISDITSFPPKHYSPQYYNPPSHGTSHVSVVDENGMAVSFTSTINLSFGSLLMEPNTGIILNNEMDDFSFPNFNNSFGIPPSPINFLAPLKRPMSSMSPTIVEHQNELKIVIGGSGGSHILSSVFQVYCY